MEQSKYTYTSIAKSREIAQPVSYLVNSSIRLLRPRRRLQLEAPAQEVVEHPPATEQEQFLSIFGLRRASPNTPSLCPEEPKSHQQTPAEVKCENNEEENEHRLVKANVEEDTQSVKNELVFDVVEDNRPIVKIESTNDREKDGRPIIKEELTLDREKDDKLIKKEEPTFDTEKPNASIAKNESMFDMEENHVLIPKNESLDFEKDDRPIINEVSHANVNEDKPATNKESIEAAMEVEEDNAPIVENVNKNPVEDKSISLKIDGKDTILQYHPQMARFYHSKVRTPEEQSKRDRNNEACRKSRARAKAGVTRRYTRKTMSVDNEI